MSVYYTNCKVFLACVHDLQNLMGGGGGSGAKLLAISLEASKFTKNELPNIFFKDFS